MAMPEGFAAALARKYDILQQQANSASTTANAEANLTNVRAGLLPAESEANVGLTGAQTRSVDENTKYVGPLANASIFNTREQGGLFHQQAVGESELNKLSKTLYSKPTGGGMPMLGEDFETKLKSILKEGLGY